MAQVFHPSTNTISKLSIVGVVLGLGGLTGAIFAANHSYGNRMYVPIEQPVQFSHKHHVLDDGIDCRYCHTSVEESAFAGIPPTHTCMTCHSQIWADSPLIQPIRESFNNSRPIEWTRVHDMPDFVYFNHSIHIKKGIGCASCHGRVDQMPITWKEHTMTMAWCLECHRNPERNIRPRSAVYKMDWKPSDEINPKTGEPETRESLGARLMDEYDIMPTQQLTNCSICHR
ncbi:MAG: cytochrome c family protein [Armatimonadota bacterium]|nr:cytochrome c family protein [Armatimonadota bacterium]